MTLKSLIVQFLGFCLSPYPYLGLIIRAFKVGWSKAFYVKNRTEAPACLTGQKMPCSLSIASRFAVKTFLSHVFIHWAHFKTLFAHFFQQLDHLMCWHLMNKNRKFRTKRNMKPMTSRLRGNQSDHHFTKTALAFVSRK